MVAPILLGILGAGLASQAAVHGWAIPEFKKRQGARATGILDELPEDAGIDDRRRALMQGGLLDVDRYAEIGFEDQASERDFLEALRIANTDNDAAYDRALLGESGANYRAELSQEGANTRQEDAQAHELGIISGEQYREADDTFWATTNALEQVVAPHNNNISMRNRALEIITELENMGRLGRTVSPEKRNNLLFELSEIDEDLFWEHKKQIYGDAEATDQRVVKLRETYPTFTRDGELVRQGLWNETKKAYTRRSQEDAQTVEGAISRAEETIGRLNEQFPNSGGGWALENRDGYIVAPTTKGGGVPDDDIDPNSIR